MSPTTLAGHEDTDVSCPCRAPWLSLHPPVHPTSEWDAAIAPGEGHHAVPRGRRHPSGAEQTPVLSPALPNCWLGPLGGRTAAPPPHSPSTSTSQKLSRQRGLFKQKEDSSSCLQPCLPPPTSAGHPAQPAPSPPGPEPTCVGLASPLRGQHHPVSPLPPPHLPPVHTHEQAVVPGLGGSLLLPQPRRGSGGSAKGMLCPVRKHGRTQAGERNQETARSTAPKSVRQTHASHGICLNQEKHGFS